MLRKDRLSLLIILALLAVVMSTIALVCSLSMHSGPKVVIFNEHDSIQSFTQAMTKNHHLALPVKERMSAAFAKVMESTVKAYSQQHHTMVISNQHVLAGGVDVSNRLNHTILDKLHAIAKGNYHA